MDGQEAFDARVQIQRELGQRRSSAPGMLKVWSGPQAGEPVLLKEVVAILRPQRWSETKLRVQRLHLLAFTQQRVLGRGRERGLRYLPRRGAAARGGVRYLPKRMISWIVEAPQVEGLIQAIIASNRTGQLGDGKIFVLPVAEAVRIRTGDRGPEALRPERPMELVSGKHASG